jgi:hypothetical protein
VSLYGVRACQHRQRIRIHLKAKARTAAPFPLRIDRRLGGGYDLPYDRLCVIIGSCLVWPAEQFRREASMRIDQGRRAGLEEQMIYEAIPVYIACQSERNGSLRRLAPVLAPGISGRARPNTYEAPVVKRQTTPRSGLWLFSAGLVWA